MPLNRNKLCHSVFSCIVICLGKLPCKAVGYTDISGFASLHNPIKSIHDFLHRGMIIPHMIDIKIHIVHTEIAKTLIQVIFYMFLSAHAAVNFFLCSRCEFRCNHIIITFCKITKCFSDILLACTILICDCRIIKIDTKVKSMLNDFSRLRLI